MKQVSVFAALLLIFEELSPVNEFPADLPYMGSIFYFSHGGES